MDPLHRFIKPNRYSELKSQFNDLVQKSKKPLILPTQKDQDVHRLPVLEKSLQKSKLNPIDFLLIRSPPSLLYSPSKSMEQSLLSTRKQNLQKSDLHRLKQNKNTHKAYFKPINKQSIMNQINVQSIILPKEDNLRQSGQAFWTEKNSFVRMRRKQTSTVESHDSLIKWYGVMNVDQTDMLIIDTQYNRTLINIIQSFGCLPEQLIRQYLQQVIQHLLSLDGGYGSSISLNLSTIYTNNQGKIRIGPEAISKISSKYLKNNGYYYYSPEVLSKKIESSKNSVWSLGCIALSLVKGEQVNPSTNEHPYNSQHLNQPLRKISKKYKKHSHRVPSPIQLSEELWDLIEGCLEMDEGHRLGLLQVKEHKFMII